MEIIEMTFYGVAEKLRRKQKSANDWIRKVVINERGDVVIEFDSKKKLAFELATLLEAALLAAEVQMLPWGFLERDYKKEE
jgi:hypothetical protein